jgi:hypothetical protein
MHVSRAAIGLIAGLLTQAPSPTPHPGHLVSYYDAALRRVVIIGEEGDPIDGVRDRMWSWSGTQWELELLQGPPGRANGAAAFDRARGVAVIAGGARKTDAGAWRKVGDAWSGGRGGWHALPGIVPRDHHALVDAANGHVLLFGGIPMVKDPAWPTDTWELRGDAWTRVAADGPAARARTAMVYDRARNEVLLFGGVSGPRSSPNDQVFFADTWIWNGSQWRKAADSGPRGRYAHGMVFDEQRGVVLLYSGAAAHKGAPLEDMWQWDGRRWSEIALKGPTPGYRYQPVMVYDAARARTVLFGGGTNDTWEWDGTRWQRVAQ